MNFTPINMNGCDLIITPLSTAAELGEVLVDSVKDEGVVESRNKTVPNSNTVAAGFYRCCIDAAAINIINFHWLS